MVESDQMVIIDEEGLHGTIVGRRETGAGAPVTVVVELTNGEQLLIPWDRVARRDSRYVFSGRFSEMERRNIEEGGRVVIPLVAEDVAVSKAARETGRVRVIKTTSEWEETVDEPLAREQVQIERVSINRPVEGPMESRQEGDTLIIPVVEEELVIQKRLLLKEEIRITKQRIEEQRPQTVTLRRQEVDIERVPTQEGGQEPARQR